jgi:ribosomal protein S19E (S16A)
MTESDRKRATSLLVTILFAGGAGQARQLRDELEQVHGVVVTLDRVRQDLNNLNDLGLVQKINDTVALTQEGRETAQGTRKLP